MLGYDIKNKKSISRSIRRGYSDTTGLNEFNESSKPTQSNIIKINSKKLPADFFTNNKIRHGQGIYSQRASTRNSKEKLPKNFQEYSSTIPLTPSFIVNR